MGLQPLIQFEHPGQLHQWRYAAHGSLEKGENTGYFEQDSKNTSIRRMHGGRFGHRLEWIVRSTISASASVRAHVSEEEDTQNSSTFGAGMELLGTGRQVNTNWSERFGNSAQLAFRHRSPKEGKEWSMDLSYYGGARKSDASQDLYTYDIGGGGPLGSSPRLQDDLGGSRYGTLSFQADLVDPRSERTKFEYGVKSSAQIGQHVPGCVCDLPDGWNGRKGLLPFPTTTTLRT